MAVVYVREQGASVRKRGGRMVVMSKDRILLMEIPMRQLTAVAVFGGVQLTTQAMTEFLDAGVSVALFTRSGRLKGHVVPAESKNVSLRLRQVEAHLSEGRSLELARGIVRVKVANQLAMIETQRSNYGSANEALGMAAEDVRRLLPPIRDCQDLDSLRGYEGAAAAAYFRAFGAMNRSALPFEGRSRYPPKDPVNAMLSFGYMLALGEIRGLVEAAGLDPHIGFLHREQYGRPSLALDLLEPYRAGVDRMVLRCVNNRVFQAGDFGVTMGGPRDGAVTLMPEALKRYLLEYESLVKEHEWRETGKGFDGDVDGMCRALRDRTAFTPLEEGGERPHAVPDFL
jgi:CRISPR-associated protein Cas1